MKKFSWLEISRYPRYKHVQVSCDMQFSIVKFIVLLLLLIQASNVFAQCVTVEPEIFLQSNEEKKAESQPVLRKPFKLSGESSISFTSILLDPLSEQERETIRTAIAKQDTTIRKKIGFGRLVPAPYCDVIDSSLYRWVTLPEGGRIAVFSVKSPEAAALRVKIKIIHFPKRAELRFYNPTNPDEVDGPYLLDQIQKQMVDGSFWSPVIESDNIAIEIFLPKGLNGEDILIAIPQIQHLWSSILDSRNEGQFADIGDSAYCNVDVACTSWGGSFAERAVAKMVFTEGWDSYICTGTLLNDKDPTTFVPYFLTAHHCISTQAAASSLITYWNFQKSNCNGPNSRTFTTRNGAELLSTGSTTDYTLLRLYQNPPSGTAFAGWTTTPVAYGKEVVGIHHPNGDLKKISFGTVQGFEDCTTSTSDGPFTCYPGNGGFIKVRWYRGIAEGGSSGSALFDNQGYVVGTLRGGSSSCQEPYLSDIYGRFDRTYPLIEQWIGKIVPIAICDAEHLNLCSSSMDCQNTGGYWYDNQCHTQPQPQPQSQCRSNNLSACITQIDCENAGGYWYNSTCNASSQPSPTPVSHNATPSHALPVVIFPTSVTPSNNTVQVGACDDIMIQPTLSVPSADLNKTATLIMYIYLPDVGFGMNVPSKTRVLTSETKFYLLSHAIDFSSSAGLNFTIYYGYVIGSTIKYNAYSVVVGSSCGGAVPNCGVIGNASSCNATTGCTWQTFPAAECILNCGVYNSQNSCENSFDGNSCEWNMTLFGEVCSPR